MPTSQIEITDSRRIKIDKHFFELRITTRSPQADALDAASFDVKAHTALVAKTVHNWELAIRHLLGITPLEENAPSAEVFVNDAFGKVLYQPGDRLPYVTVQNVNWSGPSLTMHSDVMPEEATILWMIHENGLTTYASRTEATVMANSTPEGIPDNVTPISQAPPSTEELRKPIRQAPPPPAANDTDRQLADITRQQEEANRASLNAFVRSTKPFRDGLLFLESGKTDAPQWNKVALVLDTHDRSTDTHPDKESGTAEYILYPWNGDVIINDYNGALRINFPTQGDWLTVWEPKEGKPDWEWKAVFEKTGLPEDGISVGDKYKVNADFVAIKVGEYNGKYYQNFYGFFNKPVEA